MRVRANQQGWDGKQLREPGEEFDFDGEPEKGSWMDPLDSSGRTKADITAKLDSLGVDYNKRDAKEALAAVLDAILTKKSIMEKLDNLGVEYQKDASVDVLSALLTDAEKKAAGQAQ